MNAVPTQPRSVLHPDPEVLMGLVACVEPPVLRAGVSSHVSGCEACSVEIAGLRVAAGLLFALLPSMPLASGAREKALSATRLRT